MKNVPLLVPFSRRHLFIFSRNFPQICFAFRSMNFLFNFNRELRRKRDFPFSFISFLCSSCLNGNKFSWLEIWLGRQSIDHMSNWGRAKWKYTATCSIGVGIFQMKYAQTNRFWMFGWVIFWWLRFTKALLHNY